MANDLNVVCIVGNLVRNCGANERDFVYTQNGMCIATISIASNRSRKQADGQYVDEVSYFDVKLYGKTAENLKPYLLKGQKVAVDGVLKQERWKDKNGNAASRIIINANSVQLIGGKREEQPKAAGPDTVYTDARSAIASQNNNQNPQYSEMDYQEDIPF